MITISPSILASSVVRTRGKPPVNFGMLAPSVILAAASLIRCRNHNMYWVCVNT